MFNYLFCRPSVVYFADSSLSLDCSARAILKFMLRVSSFGSSCSIEIVQLNVSNTLNLWTRPQWYMFYVRSGRRSWVGPNVTELVTIHRYNSTPQRRIISKRGTEQCFLPTFKIKLSVTKSIALQNAVVWLARSPINPRTSVIMTEQQPIVFQLHQY